MKTNFFVLQVQEISEKRPRLKCKVQLAKCKVLASLPTHPPQREIGPEATFLSQCLIAQYNYTTFYTHFAGANNYFLCIKLGGGN